MKRYLTSLLFILSSLLFSEAQTPAFPGAEGHGRYATGGRGGKIVHVTNLNDSGTGSFRQAVSGSAKKIVVFDVGGVIALKSNVSIGANTTILGQTAPAPGITLRYYTVNPNGSNIVMRFIRIRRGEEKDVNDGADASTARHFTNLMLDHCSFSWSIDEVASFYDNNNFTMQWCTIGESLNNAGHNKGAHGYGGIWGGKLASFHHNLICHVNNRSPRFCGARYNWTGYTSNTQYSEYKWENAVQAENVDLRNCVVYNCGNGCYGGPGGGKVNMVNNYFKTGPAGTTNRFTTVTVGAPGNASGYPTYWGMTSRYFIEGNFMYNNTTATSNNWSAINYDGYNSGASKESDRNDGTFVINGQQCSLDTMHYNGSDVTYYKNAAGKDCVRIKLDEPTATGTVTTHTAAQAFSKVLAFAGASLDRDDVDTRYTTEAKNGTATYKGSVTGKAGRIDKVSDVNGYTEANFGTGTRDANFDTDKDGMPDAWETANGLNPANAADALLYTLDPLKYYTNIEVYANSLVQDIMLGGNADAADEVEEYYPAYTKADGTKVEAINYKGGDTPAPSEGLTGSITWPFDQGTASQSPTFSDEIASSFLAAGVTVGSHLKYNGTKKAGDITETLFTITDETQDDNPNDNNAVTFTLTPKEGCTFTPTRVSFLATRFGTGHGKFQAYWLSADNTRHEIVAETLANRDNGENGERFSSVDETLMGVNASDGPCSLVIHLYDIPYNTNTKNLGLANIAITGIAASKNASGITGTDSSRPVSTTYYSLQGTRLSKPARGAGIRIDRMANGTKKTVKTITR